jgi:hypothetical protein
MIIGLTEPKRIKILLNTRKSSQREITKILSRMKIK